MVPIMYPGYVPAMGMGVMDMGMGMGMKGSMVSYPSMMLGSAVANPVATAAAHMAQFPFHVTPVPVELTV